MSDTDVAIQSAMQHIQAGRWNEAAAVCREILAAQPTHAAALHLLGLAAANTGDRNQAIQLINQAIAANPYVPEYHSNLSRIRHDQSQFPEAIAAARRAIQLQPKFPAALINLGNALLQNKSPLDAAKAFAQAAHLQPDSVDLQGLAGRTFLNAGDPQMATPYFQRLVELSTPAQKASAFYDLGVVLAASGQFLAAIDAYQQSIQLNPKDEWAWNNLGTSLKRINHLQEASEALRQAIQLKPRWGEAHCNLATVLIAQGKIEAANEIFADALEKSPTHPVVHYNHGVLLLLQGNYHEGWREYEWRWKCQDVHIPTRFNDPPWRGQPLEGKSILLHAEQGLGDTIQFCRYIPNVVARGGQVYLCVQPELVSLLKTFPGVRDVAALPRQLPPCQAHCYLMDLPLAFDTRLETIPNSIPYLHADSTLRDKWAGKFSGNSDLKVGLAWAGRSTHINDSHRSIRLSQFAPLASTPGVTFVSLQKGPGSEQAVNPPSGMKWFNHTADLKDVADTAALMSHLDLIITVDSAVAHLAGAMGKPVWILTPFAPDWRWLLGREDSPWYPTARLFRQSVPGDWETVLRRIREELSNFAADRAG